MSAQEQINRIDRLLALVEPPETVLAGNTLTGSAAIASGVDDGTATVQLFVE